MTKYILQFRLSMICFIISSLSLLFIPIVSTDGDGIEKVLAYFVAALFWTGLISGSILFFQANNKRKKIERQMIKEKRYKRKKAGIGIISFFRNKEALVCDILMFVSLIICIIFALTSISAKWLIMITLVLFIGSFYLHCFFNGKNYSFIKSVKTNNKEQNSDE